MMTTPYTQPQIDFKTQIALLKQEGLAFGDELKADHLLSNISLFRLKSYLHPFRQKGIRDFKPGSTFEQSYSLYKFDSALRKLIWAELEKIEVSIRTQLSYKMAAEAGNFWFTDPLNFRNAVKHSCILTSISSELHRSDDESILDFFKKYSDPYPPSWMTMEVTSFGTLSLLYKWANGGHARRAVANYYGLSDTVFESWIHSIVYVRNICGHHGRLWNRKLRIQPLVPRRTHNPFLTMSSNPQKVYYILSIIMYMLKVVNPSTTFAFRLQSLLAEYPSVDIEAMGFPKVWDSEPLWKYSYVQ